MRKFEFRLQKVLDYRILQEDWSKKAFRDARIARQDAEKILFKKQELLNMVLRQGANSIREYQTIEDYITRLSDEIESQKSIVAVLLEEEEKANYEWQEARKALKTIQKLKEIAEHAWREEVAKSEQKHLDDWTTSRRAA